MIHLSDAPRFARMCRSIYRAVTGEIGQLLPAPAGLAPVER